MTDELRGRRILVTGAATGIGAAAVSVLTDAGADVVATYHATTSAPASVRTLTAAAPIPVAAPVTRIRRPRRTRMPRAGG
ncbi:hypothetical protein MAHJHV63_50470 [Mycobacterium avium subsp. hominissuis]